MEEGGAEGLRAGAPGMGGFFRRGAWISVSARTGNDLQGYVCDADANGLLLDARDPSGDPMGYEFLPWNSIERAGAEG